LRRTTIWAYILLSLPDDDYLTAEHQGFKHHFGHMLPFLVPKFQVSSNFKLWRMLSQAGFVPAFLDPTLAFPLRTLAV
jgi:hypothetical protein